MRLNHRFVLTALLGGTLIVGGLAAPALSDTPAPKAPFADGKLQQETYTCPMHPSVTANKAGVCPECGMKLQKADAKGDYTCGMHPQVQAKGAGKCPTCGMKLTKREAKTAPAVQEVVYSCPMDPEVISSQPGQCPKCHMNLEKQTRADR